MGSNSSKTYAEPSTHKQTFVGHPDIDSNAWTADRKEQARREKNKRKEEVGKPWNGMRLC
jgi:hypothetical protein